MAGNFTLEQCIYILVFAVAVFTRLYILGVRPYHHDESIHAFFSWKITQDGVGDYKYDPVYHGPLLYYASALMMRLFGDSDFTGAPEPGAVRSRRRGVRLAAAPLPRSLGGALVPGAGHLLAEPGPTSPASCATTSTSRSATWPSSTSPSATARRARRATSTSAAPRLALAFCTKEDMYALGAGLHRGLRAHAAVGGAVRGRLAAGAAVASAARPARSSSRLRCRWSPASIIFAVIWLLLYTSFCSHPKNWNAVTRALSYWWGQHEIKRIGGPWWYYFPQLVLYDPLILFPAFLFLLAPLLARAPARVARSPACWGTRPGQ